MKGREGGRERSTSCLYLAMCVRVCVCVCVKEERQKTE